MSSARRPRSWFRVMFSPPLLLAGLAVAAVLEAIWPELAWPFPPGSEPERLAAVAVALAAVAVAQALSRHSLAYKARRELISAAAARAGTGWLNREAGWSYGVFPRGRPWCRLWTITRISEQAARDLDDDARENPAAEVPLFFEDWVILPFTTEVVRHDDVVLISPETGMVRDAPGPRFLLAMWRSMRMSRSGLGFTIASPEDVTKVAAQLLATGRTGTGEPGEHET
jgi:hypothetical protein